MKENYSMNIKNILFAEDDEDFYYFFKSALLSVSDKINVLRTANGVMLLSLMETSIQPDLIFLDINMPLRNGIDCLEEIKNKKKYKSTKVIMCSSSDDKEDIDDSYNNGADFYFIKPSGHSSLIHQFKSLFTKFDCYKNGRPPRSEFVLN